jgi:hypothetical protein
MPVLSDVLIRQTKPPKAGRLELWDDVVTGLVFRLTAGAARTWSVSYRVAGVRHRFTIGDYRTEDQKTEGSTIAEARSKARSVLRAAADGRDPQADKVRARAEARREGATLADVAGKWLENGRTTRGARAGQPWREKTRAEFTRLVNEEILPVLGDLKPEAVTKREIRGLYDRIEARAPSVAKHALAVLRLLFTWAAEEDYTDAVPLFPKRGTQSGKRTRVLEEAEARAVMKALDVGLTEARSPRPDRVEPLA